MLRLNLTCCNPFPALYGCAKVRKIFQITNPQKTYCSFFDGKCRRESHFGVAGTATAAATAPRREGAPRKRHKRSKNGTGAPQRRQRPVQARTERERREDGKGERQQERSESAAKTAKAGASKDGAESPRRRQKPAPARTERNRRGNGNNHCTNSRRSLHERQETRSARHKKEGRNTSGPPVGETRFAIRGTRAGYQPQRPSRRRRPRSGPWRASAGSCRDSRADLRSARHGRPSARPTRLRNRSAG